MKKSYNKSYYFNLTDFHLTSWNRDYDPPSNDIIIYAFETNNCPIKEDYMDYDILPILERLYYE